MQTTRRHLGLNTKVSSRGQITIPRRLIREFDVRPGDTVHFLWASESEGKLRLQAAIMREGKRIATVRILIKRKGAVTHGLLTTPHS